MAQVAHAANVNVAHRVVVAPVRTERKWKCSEAPFMGLWYCRLPSCICDSRETFAEKEALSLEGVSQMVLFRLLALVRPAFDLVLRRTFQASQPLQG